MGTLDLVPLFSNLTHLNISEFSAVGSDYKKELKI